MTQKHTPEPWEAKFSGMSKASIIASGTAIFSSISPNATYNTANAARIVECVNAMQGIEHPQKWVKYQNYFREEVANSSLSAEVGKRIALKEELAHEKQQLEMFKDSFTDVLKERDELQQKYATTLQEFNESLRVLNRINNMQASTMSDAHTCFLTLKLEVAELFSKLGTEPKPSKKTTITVDEGKPSTRS